MKMQYLMRLLHTVASVSLALLAAVSFFFIVVWPGLSSRSALHERLQALHLQEQKFGLATQQTPVLEKELEELAGLETNQEGFLKEKPPALAVADLQQMLSSIVDEAGGTLISTQILQEADGNNLFPAITVKVNLRGATESLQQILYRIDTSRPQLILDNLRVQKKQSTGAPGIDELEIRFDLTAYIYQPEIS